MLAGICTRDLVSMLKVRKRILWNAVPWIIMFLFPRRASPGLLFTDSFSSLPGLCCHQTTEWLRAENTHLLTAPSFAVHDLLKTVFTIIFYLEMLFPEK